MLPVMFATKTWPSPRTLTASTKPVTAERTMRTRGRGSFGSAIGGAMLLLVGPVRVARGARILRRTLTSVIDGRSRWQEIEERQTGAHRQAPPVVDNRDRNGQCIDNERSHELDGQLAQEALIELVPNQPSMMARIKPNEEPCGGGEQKADRIERDRHPAVRLLHP